MQPECKKVGARRAILLAAGCTLPLLVEAQPLLADLDDGLSRLLPWFEQAGFTGVLLFAACDALLVVLLLPVIVLAIGAGVIFGIVHGTLVMVVATTTGATIAFLIGRHALGPRLRAWLLRKPYAHALAHALRDGGWWTVAALRMTPLFPFKSTNYVFGALDLRLRDFVLGTAAGILPLTATAVTLGALAGDVSAVLARRSPHPIEWLLYGMGLLCALVVAAFLMRRARRLLGTAGASAP